MDINYDGRIKIVLFNPEIPANTGNIGRLCLGADTELHIIQPMRFFINDKYLKRAGLDYWEKVKVFIHASWTHFLEAYPEASLYYCSTKGKKLYTEVDYKDGDFLVFGPESRGLPENMLFENIHRVITIPMHNEIRSINLCNSVAIIMYEAIRQFVCQCQLYDMVDR